MMTFGFFVNILLLVLIGTCNCQQSDNIESLTAKIEDLKQQNNDLRSQILVLNGHVEESNIVSQNLYNCGNHLEVAMHNITQLNNTAHQTTTSLNECRGLISQHEAMLGAAQNNADD
eukprot:Awhi_evm1s114